MVKKAKLKAQMGAAACSWAACGFERVRKRQVLHRKKPPEKITANHWDMRKKPSKRYERNVLQSSLPRDHIPQTHPPYLTRITSFNLLFFNIVQLLSILNVFTFHRRRPKCLITYLFLQGSFFPLDSSPQLQTFSEVLPVGNLHSWGEQQRKAAFERDCWCTQCCKKLTAKEFVQARKS